MDFCQLSKKHSKKHVTDISREFMESQHTMVVLDMTASKLSIAFSSTTCSPLVKTDSQTLIPMFYKAHLNFAMGLQENPRDPGVRSPADSWLEKTYPFSSDPLLRRQYQRFNMDL